MTMGFFDEKSGEKKRLWIPPLQPNNYINREEEKNGRQSGEGEGGENP